MHAHTHTHTHTQTQFLELPVTAKPLELLIAPSDEDYCLRTLYGISPDPHRLVQLYRRFQARLPPIELPAKKSRGKRKRGAGGGRGGKRGGGAAAFHSDPPGAMVSLVMCTYIHYVCMCV